MAERRRRGDRRLQGEPSQEHQHQGGRDLRVLRLQRVVRRRRRPAGVQDSSSTSGSRTRWRRSTTARPRRASSCSRRSRTRISAIRTCPTARENNARLELYTAAMARSRRPAACAFVDLFAPTPGALRDGEDAADDQRRPPERGRQPPRRRDHRPRPVRRAAAHLRAQLPVGAAARRRRQELPLVQPLPHHRRLLHFGDRAFLTFVKGNPRNVNPTRVQVDKEDVLPTNYEVLEREIEVLDVMTANRDERIWRIARGLGPSPAEVKVDDSDTPPFIPAPTSPARARTARTSSSTARRRSRKMRSARA